MALPAFLEDLEHVVSEGVSVLLQKASHLVEDLPSVVPDAKLLVVDLRLDVEVVNLHKHKHKHKHIKHIISRCIDTAIRTLCAPCSFSSRLVSVPLGNLLSSSSRSRIPSFYNQHIHT